MESEGLEITRLELKYCERCGRLWLRQRGTGKVHCGLCASETSNFPLCGHRINRSRLLGERFDIESQDETERINVYGGWGHA